MQNNFNYVPKNQFSSYFNNQSYNPAQGVGTSTNNIVWVQGIEGAKAWQLNPNSMVILLDSEADGKMYIKVSDNIGMSTLRIFNYTEVLPQANSSQAEPIKQDLDLSLYVRKDELSKLLKELMANEQSIQTTQSTTDGDSAKPKVTYLK